MLRQSFSLSLSLSSAALSPPPPGLHRHLHAAEYMHFDTPNPPDPVGRRVEACAQCAKGNKRTHLKGRRGMSK